MNASPKILLIEDDEAIAEPLIFGLQNEGLDVSHAATGAQGIALARATAPDVVLLDVMLPDMDGFAVCRALRRESAAPILMLTARGQEMDRVMGLELGADDYIVKPFSFRELIARIRAALRRRELDRGTAPASDRVTVGDLMLDRTARQVWRRGALLELSPREFDLLVVLMDHLGEAMSRQGLLDLVWGVEWVGSPRTLDVHIRWLREKIETDSGAPDYIETVRAFGYRFVDPTARGAR
ncbi:MAG: response regulator transcription factor [Chloroflexi bacterium]|nr:response regulator transcription factor [Chloroflexota bacterium]